MAGLTQPIPYPINRPFHEPDWRRFPGWSRATRQEWENALWQRRNSVKSVMALKAVLGSYLPDDLAAGIEQDQRQAAVMPLLITPQMMNTDRKSTRLNSS